MTGSNFLYRTIFLSLTGPGIAGNLILFMKHACTSIVGTEKKPIDFILIQLAITNVMTLCCTGIAAIRSTFHFSNFLDNVVCKSVIYLARVARGLSICTTCLLSVVQAITISPKTTPWRKLKPHTAWQVLPCLLLFWILNFLISSNLLHYITAVRSTNKSEIEMPVGYCYMLPPGQIIRCLFLLLMTLRDVIFQSLMGWSSGYMAFCLYKHHKRVLYLHSSNNSNPEIRATLSILMLMTCFLFFYWADFIISLYVGSILTVNPIIVSTNIILGVGYASLSPFVLISRDVHPVKHWCRH
ncbi:putative vomeronasal receptor-like protein 4 [Ctenodactylus gundi]